MVDAVIKVENVSKKFCRSLKHVMRYGIEDISRNMLGIRSRSEQLRDGEFWAVDDVSFELKRGETLGIIGANGSGKSTLLKMINGIFMPDKGRIQINGRVGGLIEVGAGFHPMLTGRENIYINGAILGMGKKEIDKKFDEIIEFADIGDFIDSPVKYYSSGMYVRLGFAVAVHCEPEILLIDEILSVGDIAFRQKSINRMMEIVNSGVTICFVSHDIMAVENICKRVIWLDSGHEKILGATGDVIEKYMMYQREKAISKDTTYHSGYNETGLIWVENCELVDENSRPRTGLKYRDQLIVRIHYVTKCDIQHPYFMVYIVDSSGTTLFHANMLADGGVPEVLDGKGWLEVDFGRPPLYPGAYGVRVRIRQDSTTEHFYCRTVNRFRVVASPEDYGYTGQFKSTYTYSSGIALPYEYRWGPSCTSVKVTHGNT